MQKENHEFEVSYIDLREIELEAKAAQAQAARDSMSWLGRAAVRAFKAPTSLFGGTNDTGISSSFAYRKRLRRMKGQGIQTSML